MQAFLFHCKLLRPARNFLSAVLRVATWVEIRAATWCALTKHPSSSRTSSSVPSLKGKTQFVAVFRTRRHAAPTHTFHDGCTRRLRFLLSHITRRLCSYLCDDFDLHFLFVLCSSFGEFPPAALLFVVIYS